MGGGHGRSWSFHGPAMGSSQERGGEEGEGRGEGGTGVGRYGEAGASWGGAPG
jgi:hypothetical protein